MTIINQAKRLSGLNPLSYMGVDPISPAQFVALNEDPNANDWQNFNLGAVWLNTTNEKVWFLVSLQGNQATWVQFTGGAGSVIGLHADDGNNAFPLVGLINIHNTDGFINITAATPHTVTLNLNGAHIATTYTEDAGSAVPAAGNLNVLGGTAGRDINTSGAGSTIHIDLNNSITLGDLSAIGAGSNALSCTTGDVNIASGNLKLPNSTATTGQVQLGGNRFVHNFGTNNTFIGQTSGNFTLTVASAISNTGIGINTLSGLTTGNGNVAIGVNALTANQTSNFNMGIGTSTLINLTGGSGINVAIGNSALSGIATGTQNVCIGPQAGGGLTLADSSNILIGSVSGVAGWSNTIQIGVSGGLAGQQNRCFIAGIRGITTGVADAVAVLVDSASQLGTISSSRRYKENIEDMEDASDIIYDLKPKIFNFKKHPNVPAWGLIAEEVDEVFPQLVVYDDNKNPEAVKYHDLVPLLLNEVQKLSKRITELEKNKGN